MPYPAFLMAMIMAGSLLEIEPGILRLEGEQIMHIIGEHAFNLSNGLAISQKLAITSHFMIFFYQTEPS